jgi:hypothetical protein
MYHAIKRIYLLYGQRLFSTMVPLPPRGVTAMCTDKVTSPNPAPLELDDMIPVKKVAFSY